MEGMHDFLLIGLGLLIGALGTLIGAGGGFILVPVLLLLNPSMKPEIVTSISLGVVFLNAFSGSLAYARMRRVDYRSALVFALATLPGAMMGAYITEYISRNLFNIILGTLLILLSLFLLIRPDYRKKTHPRHESKLTHRTLTDSKGQSYSYSFNIRTGIVLSFLVGYLASFLGIGGGIIHVTALTTLLSFPVHIATATSHLILAIMALAGTMVHIYQGNLKGEWLTIFFLGIGVIGGAQIGAYLSHHIRPLWIVRVLAIALFLVGIRLFF